MSEISTKDWTPYAVGKPSTKKNWAEPACQSLESVLHVTHIHSALNVLGDGKISPQLIYDKSRLNTDRILVVWVSPNDWGNAGGFRYGNVAFELRWKELIRGKRFYWVGVTNYTPRACRILITDQDRDSQLLPYDPLAGNGPWWYDKPNDEHYWNGSYCLEFMLEAPILLDNVYSVRFVTHHPKRCSIDPASCSDRGLDGQRGGARLLAGACARRVLRRSLWLDDDKPTKALKAAWKELRQLLRPKIDSDRGPVLSGDSGAAALGRSVMEAIHQSHNDDWRQLIGLFASHNDAVESCAKLIEGALGVAQCTLKRVSP